jgi:hypothetical protein
MELLEKYLDHPQRDEIIAREMGWSHLADEWREEDFEDVPSFGSEEATATAAGRQFEDNALYRASFELTVWLDKLFESNTALQNEPAAVKLATQAALASAKLAAALSDEDDVDLDELGMTIAYLKRALKAITTAMDAAAQMEATRLLTPPQFATVQKRLFQVRDGVVSLMGEYRGEWLRRFGSL